MDGFTVFDQARDANRRLGPLLRRKGTSVEVGRGIRRAIQQLDAVLAGGSASSEAIDAVTAELRSCVGVISRSNVPADHDQLEGVSAALAILAPPSVERAPTNTLLAAAGRLAALQKQPGAEPAPASQPAEIAPSPLPFVGLREEVPPAPPLFVPPREQDTPAPLEPSPPATDPGRAGTIISSLLSKLTRLHHRRRVFLRDPLTPWRTFKAVNIQIQHAIQSIKWIGVKGLSVAEAALAAAEAEDERFAAATVLLHTGGSKHCSRLSSSGPPRTKRPLPARSSRSEWRGRHRGSCVWRPLLDSGTSQARTFVLAIFAEHGRISADRLIALLDDPSDEVSTCAASLLAWIGRSPNDKDPSGFDYARGPRRTSMRAVVCGRLSRSTRALDELRRMLDTGVAVTPLTIDALAVAGGPDDADRLLRLAVRQPDLGPLAVLAAGHLGNPAISAAISETSAEESLRARSLRTIWGEVDAPRAESRGGRLLYGAPWTIPAALTCLATPDELLRSRPWYALKVALRAGIRPNAAINPQSLSEIQEGASAQARATVTAQRQSLPEGSWFYLGSFASLSPSGRPELRGPACRYLLLP